MAFRTTADAVREIIEVDELILSLDVFLTLANELTTEFCVDVDPSPGYTTTRLALIEQLLAAHFYTMRDPRINNERAGSVGASYQFNTGLFLQNSVHGQNALAMDTAGGLARYDARLQDAGKVVPDIGVTWLGSDDCQDDDEDE